MVVHGPSGLGENVPCGEFERNVTATGVVTLAAIETVSGGEAVPAEMVVGAAPMVRVDCVHVRNDCQAALWLAPGMSTRQRESWPGGPHAPVPDVSGSMASAESRIEAASRSRSWPVCVAKSPAGMPVVLLGAHANPQWSRACPVAAVK